MQLPTLTPRLVIERAARAIPFYERALGATCVERFDIEGGGLAHAALTIGDFVFALTDADGALNEDAHSLGGSAVILHLLVEDVDAVSERMVAEGAEVIIPIDDRPYGYRDVRLQDPFGQLWLIGTPLKR